MIVGEGPGEQEDRQGRPFVGRAGQLLTRLLAAVDLPRETVFIGNVVKCRPPNNRPPRKDEIRACQSYLQRQIALLQPDVIVTLGGTAAAALLGPEVSITQAHGQWQNGCVLPGVNVPIFPTFHPAAALRSPAWREALEEDLAALAAELKRRET
jgi:DNA polymerase